MINSLRSILLISSLVGFPSGAGAQAVPPDMPPQKAVVVTPTTVPSGFLGQTEPTLRPALEPADQNAPSPPLSTFQSQALGDVGLWGVSATHPGIPVLNSGLWKNADVITVGIVLERLMPTTRFPSMQDLARAALFSGGAAPLSGDDAMAARRRFEAASRFGPAVAAADLAARAPRLVNDANIAKIAADAAFAVGRSGDACAITQTIGGAGATALDTYWLQARAVCYLVANEPAAADLAADLAFNQGLKDPWFFSAIAKATGASVAKPPNARYDSGLVIELSARAGLSAPKELLAALSPAAASALTARDDTSAGLKASIASRAAFTGALYAQDWGKLLDAAPVIASATPVPKLAGPLVKPAIPSKPGAKPAVAAKPATPPVSPALEPWLGARRAVIAAGQPRAIDPVTGLSPSIDPALKTAALTSAVKISKTVAERAISGEMFAAELAATPETLDTALIEAALLAWDIRTAARLRAGLSIPIEPTAANRMVALDAALSVAGAPIDNPSSVADRRIDLSGGSDISARAGARDVLLMAAAGVPVTVATRRAVIVRGLPTGPRPSGATMVALRSAVERNSMGEVALLASLATQDLDPATLDAEAGATLVRALKDVGLDRAARGLARDLILAARGLS